MKRLLMYTILMSLSFTLQAINQVIHVEIINAFEHRLPNGDTIPENLLLYYFKNTDKKEGFDDESEPEVIGLPFAKSIGLQNCNRIWRIDFIVEDTKYSITKLDTTWRADKMKHDCVTPMNGNLNNHSVYDSPAIVLRIALEEDSIYIVDGNELEVSLARHPNVGMER